MGVFLLSGCRNDPPPVPVKIGLIVYDDGYSVVDTATLHGAEMAVANLQAAGGLLIENRRHKIELVVEKVSTNPEEAVLAARKLINRENVVALVGPQYSSGAIPVGAIAELARVPMISPSSTHPDTTKNRAYVFRMSFLDDLQARAMALFAYHEIDARKAAVIYNEAEPYSRGIASVFRESFTRTGGQVVSFERFATGESDFAAQLGSVIESKPDVLFLPVFQDNLEMIVGRARKAGLESRLLGTDAWEQDRLAAMSDFNNSFMTNSWSGDIPGEETAAFVREFRTRYTAGPNGDAALTYDALQLIFKAISHEQSFSPESIRMGLYALDMQNGVAGKIDFVESGDPVKSVVVMCIKNGRNAFYKIFSPEELKTER